jgi:phosphoribosyl 1,2-cyclic phosphate phosphodiesterase
MFLLKVSCITGLVQYEYICYDKIPDVKITLLGTGTSQGVPVIACSCPVCQSEDPRDRRLRSSILIEKEGKILVIDTGPDFRQQMLTQDVKDLTAILFTHEHKDHVAGLDDVRAFNFILKRHMDVYAEKRVQEALKREYAYIFSDEKYPGVPRINMHLIQNREFNIGEISVLPIRAYHYRLPVFGFRIDNFAYLTDVKSVPDEELYKLKNLEILVLTALRKQTHISHMNLDEAVNLINRVKPVKTYLTHLSHAFGLHREEEAKLPPHIRIAYDGLSISL